MVASVTLPKMSESILVAMEYFSDVAKLIHPNYQSNQIAIQMERLTWAWLHQEFEDATKAWVEQKKHYKDKAVI